MKAPISLLAALVLAAACSHAPEQIFTEASDVGSVSIPGTFSFDKATDTYTLTGAGVNLWNDTDACFIVWKEISGDFVLSGDVTFEGEGVNPHRKIGFMIRESMDPHSRYADIAIHGDGLTSLQYRAQTGAPTLEETPDKTSRGTTPIRLTRKGSKLSMCTGDLAGADEASIEMDLPAECVVGLYICSHEEDLTETAYFRNVRLEQ